MNDILRTNNYKPIGIADLTNTTRIVQSYCEHNGIIYALCRYYDSNSQDNRIWAIEKIKYGKIIETSYLINDRDGTTTSFSTSSSVSSNYITKNRYTKPLFLTYLNNKFVLVIFSSYTSNTMQNSTIFASTESLDDVANAEWTFSNPNQLGMQTITTFASNMLYVNGTYYMAQYSTNNGSSSADSLIVLWNSTDLVTWSYKIIFTQDNNTKVAPWYNISKLRFDPNSNKFYLMLTNRYLTLYNMSSSNIDSNFKSRTSCMLVSAENNIDTWTQEVIDTTVCAKLLDRVVSNNGKELISYNGRVINRTDNIDMETEGTGYFIQDENSNIYLITPSYTYKVYDDRVEKINSSPYSTDLYSDYINNNFDDAGCSHIAISESVIYFGMRTSHLSLNLNKQCTPLIESVDTEQAYIKAE